LFPFNALFNSELVHSYGGSFSPLHSIVCLKYIYINIYFLSLIFNDVFAEACQVEWNRCSFNSGAISRCRHNFISIVFPIEPNSSSIFDFVIQTHLQLHISNWNHFFRFQCLRFMMLSRRWSGHRTQHQCCCPAWRRCVSVVTCDVWRVTCDVWCVTIRVRTTDGEWRVAFDVWRATCDVWRVTCDVWCVTCDVWRVMCDVWRVTCDVWRVMCDVWRVTCDVWCVMCDVW
jgi:hypothetical protein